tara:strand:+ start:63 stop:1046 length:984 start_codon:yes stop_codon:yes gene_type:complete
MKNNTIKFLVDVNDEGKRLDVLLSKNVKENSRSSLKKFIKDKKVTVNKSVVFSPSKKLKSGDEVQVVLQIKNTDKLKPYKKRINKLFEDTDILIIDKPVGLVVHPGAGNYEKTLVNILIDKYKNKLSDLNGDIRPGIVHRLDKDTSGILVIAKNNFAHYDLGEKFSNHEIKRSYLGLVWGVLRPLKGKINNLITRNKKNRKLMTISDIEGKRAITNYNTIKIFDYKNIPKISLIKFELETGRTHQIRVHMLNKKTSLLGDRIYGKKNIKFKKIDKKFDERLSNLKGQALHACYLGFNHPRSGKFIEFESEIPGEFKKLLNYLDKFDN